MTTIGTSIARLEERKLLTGAGQFTADVCPADAVHAVFVRSPHAHARIIAIDTQAARRARGVRAVLTGDDAKAAGLGQLRCPLKLPGHAMFDPQRPILADGIARFVGEAVVCVVAETAAQAVDAAELIAVDYQPLASVTDTGCAIGGAQIWPRRRTTSSFDWSAGDAAATEQAFAGAARVVSLDIVNNRVAVAPIETRCAWARYDAAADRYFLHTPSQGVFFIRDCLAEQVFHIRAEQLDVVTGDVGGAFGMKIVPYPEHACVLWAAKVTRRPVVWISERSESFLTDTHARDHVTRASLALDAQGRILALKHDVVAKSRRLSVGGVAHGADARLCEDGAERLRDPGDAHTRARRLHQHRADRRLSRRRQAGGVVRAGAVDRHGRARDGHRSRGAAPAQSHSADDDALQDGVRTNLRCRRFHARAEPGADARRSRQFREAAPAVGKVRAPARVGPRLLHPRHRRRSR